MSSRIADLLKNRRGENFDLHEKHLNTQMVRVLKTIGYDRVYVRAQGPYLYDDQDREYLDLLSGFGVFALGRNHPQVVGALKDVLDAQLPDLVQMDVSLLSGLLSEKILQRCPGDLSRMFYCNSGAEAVEAAIKFARYTTKREKIVYCEHGFHGLTLGALSLNGEQVFRDGFGPLLPACKAVPFNDLGALEAALRHNDVAAFIVEPIQGKGVNLPDEGYLAEAARLCRKHGALFVADEIQTGIGRTGKFWAIEHWGVEPDMILMAKALSGGFIPVGAVAMKKHIMEAVFNRMDRAVVHGSTFSKNNMAMAAGIATLEVLAEERLVENAAKLGEQIISGIRAMTDRYELLHAVRGKGMMIAVEFGAPKSFSLKAAWSLLETANKGLFSQMITIPLFKNHRILSQVAGHGMNVVKFLPPLVIGQRDADWILQAMDTVIADCHKVPGAIWDLGKNLTSHALKTKAG
ncbi:putative acetylornithine aminotransferase [Methylococcus capsulatus str. Bath]|jgi:ornithine--oxo-acid transaminase|uniref:Acetylornithine aminotransferase n=2 Tax=Methylococcus capsulatus TaxID=414 RepID=A0AA35V316_METCP|nr:aspartate aminotransferase family protein [Methylococcus capsulatus]AAU92883.1 putative acetylornithine aminotransferase [Methylococcus capsulatus str. Bath]CAI8745107.1 putative acetylornithine aminotransferase [Methylococcus capsulatus]